MNCEYRNYIRRCTLWALVFPLLIGAQEKDHLIYGQVFEFKTGLVVPAAHVANTRSEQGTLTDALGRFHLNARTGDTLVFSHLSYSYSTVEVSDSNYERELIVRLKEQNYLLDEVGIFAYELTSNDPKEMEIGEPLVPREEDIVMPVHLPATMANPLDLLYEQFGKTPRQLRELKKLVAKDAFRRKLAGRNGEILRELTGMSREEVATFSFYCRYSPRAIRHATDYQLLVSLLDCYDAYVEEQNMQELLEEWD